MESLGRFGVGVLEASLGCDWEDSLLAAARCMNCRRSILAGLKPEKARKKHTFMVSRRDDMVFSGFAPAGEEAGMMAKQHSMRI